MEQNEIQEKAYMAYSKAMNFQPGDLVKVTHKVPNHAGGWPNGWDTDMDAYIGGQHIIAGVNDIGIEIQRLPYGRRGCHFPAFCLELIERKASPKKKDNWMTIEIEEVEDKVTVISIKNAKILGFPNGYNLQSLPSFEAAQTGSPCRVYSTAGKTFFEIKNYDTILEEGETYPERTFIRAIAFLKKAGERLTNIKRELRKSTKPKRRTITI